MRVRIKSQGFFGSVRIDYSSKIDSIVGENEDITILFKGKEASGILNLNKSELESLGKFLNKKKPTIPLIGEIKSIKPKKARKVKPKTKVKRLADKSKESAPKKTTKRKKDN